MRKMRKSDPASAADQSEGKNVKPGDSAPTDYEEGVEGAPKSGTEKSEDPASDSEHISHPRPEEGEEEQRGGVSKSDDDDEDDWGDEDEDDAEKAENTEEEEGALTSAAQSQRNEQEITAKKSLTPGDLEKSIARLQRYTENGTVEGRKDSLLRKAQAGLSLSKSERRELFDLLGGKTQQPQSLAKSVTQGLQSNDGLQKALDVSEYLAEQHSELTKSLSALSTHIERSDARQHEFNLVLAKAVADVGNLVKAVAEAVEAFGGQPVRAPKSRGVVQPLQKSMAGQSPVGDSLSKSQVLDTMENLLVDSMAKGNNGRLNGDGEDISLAISKFESFNQISPAMHQAVLERAKTRAA